MTGSVLISVGVERRDVVIVAISRDLGLPVTAAAQRSRGGPEAASFRLTIRAILVFAATIIATNAIAQETTNAFELNPAVMDRWLVVQKEIVARHKADLAAGKTQDEAEAQKFLEEACGKAGFASTDECGSIIGVGYPLH